jgi:hypothetical protein
MNVIAPKIDVQVELSSRSRSHSARCPSHFGNLPIWIVKFMTWTQPQAAAGRSRGYYGPWFDFHARHQMPKFKYFTQLIWSPCRL